MKRITTLLLAAFFLVGSAVAGHAESNIDVKVKGQWDFVFGWADNTRHLKHLRDNDNGIAAQRIRTQINFVASENLQGVLQFEIGDIHWGQGGSEGRGSGGRVGADGVNIETKHAYLDWMLPSTDLRIRMGLQGLALPMATGMGSPIFDDDVAGIVASYKIDDTFSLTAFWIRPYNAYNNDDDWDDTNSFSNNRSIDDETDMFGLIAPIALDGITITPWGMWANIGDGSGFHPGLFDDSMFWNKPGDSGWIRDFESNSNDRTTAWWAGLGVAVDLWDPLTFAVDAMYGHMQAANFNIRDQAGTEKNMRVGTEGWFIAANLDYKLDWGTPGIFGWYSTGDDWDDVKDDGMLGRLPVMSNSATFAPTSFGFDGGFGISSDQVLGYSGTGLWGIGIQIADMSFIEDLTHTIRFVYMEGTNDADVIKKSGRSLPFLGDFYLTDKDHAFEVNFDHKYQIYENLAAVLELGYINMDLDKSTWKHNVSTNGHHKTEDAWKAQLSFQYKF